MSGRLTRRNMFITIAAVIVVAALVVTLAIVSRFGRAEDLRAEAASTVATAQLIRSRIPADAAAIQAQITSAMPRTLDEARLRSEITEIAAGYGLEVVETADEWNERLRAGRPDSAADLIMSELALSELRDRSLVEPVTTVISLTGKLSDLTAFMTALSQRRSNETAASQLLLRHSEVLVTFNDDIAIATFEVVGVRLSALPPELRVLLTSTQEAGAES
jgi:hypothetical protein